MKIQDCHIRMQLIPDVIPDHFKGVRFYIGSPLHKKKFYFTKDLAPFRLTPASKTEFLEALQKFLSIRGEAQLAMLLRTHGMFMLDCADALALSITASNGKLTTDQQKMARGMVNQMQNQWGNKIDTLFEEAYNFPLLKEEE